MLISKQGDAITILDADTWPAAENFAGDGVIAILLHGFTSHGRYLIKLGHHLRGWGTDVFLFNYNSGIGIRDAAKSLSHFLHKYDAMTDGRIRKRGVLLIAHSMGGLVARTAVLTDADTARTVRGIVTLGTPNDGAFVGHKLVKYVVAYGENLAGVMGIKPAKSLSSKELTKSDQGKDRPLIDWLNTAWTSKQNLPPVLTISGGLRKLEFAKNGLVNGWINRKVQKWMGKRENDGLVTDNSVSVLNGKCAGVYEHYRSYPDFQQINHTYLITNAQVALKICEWMKSLGALTK
jgi:pimeloyl-ACP methyl ester carboxylesterase